MPTAMGQWNLPSPTDGFPDHLSHSTISGQDGNLKTMYTLEKVWIQGQGRYLLICSISDKQSKVILDSLLIIAQCEKKKKRRFSFSNTHASTSVCPKHMSSYSRVAGWLVFSFRGFSIKVKSKTPQGKYCIDKMKPENEKEQKLEGNIQKEKLGRIISQ